MSQSIIMTFASSKGGVGKSTACAAIAGTLAARGCRVTILDFDQNLTLDRWHSKHKPPIPGLLVVPCQPQSFNQAIDTARAANPHFILIDIAGSYEATVIKAISASTIVVTPAKLSEPDLTEAAKILAEVRAFNKRFGVTIQHRVLINEAEPLDPQYQRHTLAELDGSAIRRLTNMMVKRVAYREIFISGLPPHFADQTREPVRKAALELDHITGELLSLIGMPMEEAA
jgi:chromosome partitioning protein